MLTFAQPARTCFRGLPSGWEARVELDAMRWFGRAVEVNLALVPAINSAKRRFAALRQARRDLDALLLPIAPRHCRVGIDSLMLDYIRAHSVSRLVATSLI